MVDSKGDIDASGAKRRLDLETKPKEIVNPYKKKLIKNPYTKKQKSTESTQDEAAHPSSITSAAGSTTASSATTSIITPETGIEKFFTKDKQESDGKKSSSAKRKLVSPRGERDVSADTTSGHVEDFYYHSDDSNTQSKRDSGSDYHPDHIHGIIDYHHRGEVTLTTGQKNAYRFIRNHFNVPRDIELNSEFGPWSGICFEERILRAYTLDQLMPKKVDIDGRSLKVCTYCGEEGHLRNKCIELI